MVINKLDAEGLPPRGVEHTLAHHFLGRPSPLCRQVLYAMLGGPRRFSELEPFVRGKSKNNLTDALDVLEKEGLVVPIHDTRSPQPGKSYRLTTLGLLVVDWMRRYEFVEQIRASGFAPEPTPADG